MIDDILKDADARMGKSIEALKNEIAYNPERLEGGINTVEDEYWPVISLDGQRLVFTRLIKENNGMLQEDFYISQYDLATWEKAEALVNINTNKNMLLFF